MSTFHDTGPVTNAADVTPDDDTDIDIPRAIWVGGAGNMSVVMASSNLGAAGATVTYVGIAAGTLLPIRVRRVRATDTTASSILALY